MPFRRLAALLCLLAGLALPARGADLEKIADFGPNPGALDMYAYRPDGAAGPRPLVAVLHGCNQDAAEQFARSGWREAADAGGFMLLLPGQRIAPFFPWWMLSVRNHPTRCFNFAQRHHSTRDSGEVASIRQMIAFATARLGADPARIFVTGLSAGAGMTSALLATYPEVFVAGAPIAGPPFRCGLTTLNAPASCGVTLEGRARNPAPERSARAWGDLVRAAAPRGFAGPWPRVSIWQGGADATVDPANAGELVEQWTDVHGIDAIADAETRLGPLERAEFRDAAGATLVELNLIPGFGHATPIDPDDPRAPCGRTGAFIRDANVCSTREIARFFGLPD